MILHQRGRITSCNIWQFTCFEWAKPFTTFTNNEAGDLYNKWRLCFMSVSTELKSQHNYTSLCLTADVEKAQKPRLACVTASQSCRLFIELGGPRHNSGLDSHTTNLPTNCTGLPACGKIEPASEPEALRFATSEFCKGYFVLQ